jgi:XTP/dITP diphosphohydrolase
MKIVLASNNQSKLKEFKEIFKDDTILSLKDINFNLDIEETGKSFKENAYIKASTIRCYTNLPVIADDSGLEVFILFGKPGINSHRYSVSQTDIDNNLKLLKEMENIENRKARFKTVLCYIDKDHIFYSEGIVYGKISKELKGENGFGYDPLFIPDGYDLTFGEMPSKFKNKLSHRSRAIKSLRKILYENNCCK